MNSKNLVVKCLTVLLVLCVSVFAQAQQPVKVVGVSDGDTVKVLTSEKKELRIRLDGIDAPESAQPFGSASKKWLSDQVFGKTVQLYPKELDRYGRTVGRIELDGKNVNLASVRAGMAWWYRQYAPTSKELKAAEAEARAAKRGIWSEPRAVAPWEWRRGSRSPSTDGNFSAPGSSSPSSARTSGQGSRRTERPVTVPGPNTIVYITRGGSKYHADGCRYLSRSRIPIAMKDAVKPYDPCTVCGGGFYDNFSAPGSSSPSSARTSGQGSRRTEKPIPAPAVGTIVYVTRTGSKYHADGCRYLNRSRIPMAKKDAVKVYDACSVCGGG